MQRTSVLAGAGVAVAFGIVCAQDAPGLRGPKGDGTYPEATLRSDWRANPPKVLWRTDVGYGFSAAVVTGERVITAGYAPDEGQSALQAFDASTGKALWRTAYADSCGGPRRGLNGPIATPLIEDGRVYMVAAMGALYAFDLATGAKVWEAAANRDKDAARPYGEFGDGVSPAVFDDLIVVQLSLTTNSAAWQAYGKKDGKLVWSHPVEDRPGDRKPGDRAYSPPAMRTWNGKRLLVLVSSALIEGVDLRTGERMWSHSLADLQMRYGPFPEPVFFENDKFFLGCWYSLRGTAIAFQMTEGGLSRLWSNSSIGKGAYSTVVRDGHAYGYGAEGLHCVDLQTGKVRWKWRSPDPAVVKDQGEIILVGDKLVWLSTSGMLYIADASPERREPLAEFKAIGPCGKPLGKDKARYNNVVSTSPALSGGRLFCRAGWGELVALDFRAPAR
jgi:outer membrane protein assembly factor BamB